MKIKNIIQHFQKELQNDFSSDEIETLIFFSLNKFLGLSRSQISISESQFINLPLYEKLIKVVSELKSHKPIQYILERTEFYGCTICVNPSVLIPRPETEELVDLIISAQRTSANLSPNILDIGTGSGCIPIVLKKNIPESTVTAFEISEEALMIAKENGIKNKTKINFVVADILNDFNSDTPISTDRLDIIISNPPYIRLSEKGNMNKNVVDYEPHLALFVEDNNPLIFYNAIANFAITNLSQNGILYLEINEMLGEDTKNLLQEKGFENVQVIKDMSGKDRFVTSRLRQNK